jgi:hypothetical protein
LNFSIILHAFQFPVFYGGVTVRGFPGTPILHYNLCVSARFQDSRRAARINCQRTLPECAGSPSRDIERIDRPQTQGHRLIPGNSGDAYLLPQYVRFRTILHYNSTDVG